MKTKFFILTVLIISLLSSCTSKSVKKGKESNLTVFFIDVKNDKVSQVSLNLKGLDLYLYQQDSIVFASQNSEKTFDSKNAKMYFVKKWNTPSYFSCNDKFTGEAWDSHQFLGTEKDGFVYFLDKYTAYSNDYIKKIGNNFSIIIEKKFPLDGVTTDPRQTCNWLSSLSENRGKIKEISIFLKEVLDVSVSDSYFNKIKKQIILTKGKTVKEKIINYTALSVSGNPKNWDAWTWPGYY